MGTHLSRLTSNLQINMLYLKKLTVAIQEREGLAKTREVMTLDEILQYLVDYGMSNTETAEKEIKTSEKSELLDLILEKIRSGENTVAESPIRRSNLPTDIQIAL